MLIRGDAKTPRRIFCLIRHVTCVSPLGSVPSLRESHAESSGNPFIEFFRSPATSRINLGPGIPRVPDSTTWDREARPSVPSGFQSSPRPLIRLPTTLASALYLLSSSPFALLLFSCNQHHTTSLLSPTTSLIATLQPVEAFFSCDATTTLPSLSLRSTKFSIFRRQATQVPALRIHFPDFASCWKTETSEPPALPWHTY